MSIEKVFLTAYKKDSSGCKVCACGSQADNLKHAIARLNGVSKVKVDDITGKTTIEYDPQKIALTKITERMQKLGYEVEVLSKGESK